MQMMSVLKPIAFDVIICMSELFDYYLYTVSEIARLYFIPTHDWGIIIIEENIKIVNIHVDSVKPLIWSAPQLTIKLLITQM